MSFINKSLINFASGIISPKVSGRFDLTLYKNGCKDITNFICETQGGVRFRTGTKFVHHTRLNRVANFIPFQYNDEQSYLLEFTNKKMRVYKDGGIVVEPDKNITAVTQANPCKVTVSSHGYTSGDEIFIYDVGGMTELNGKSYLVSVVDADNFTLSDIDGNNIDSTSYGAYTSGGVTERIVEIDTPFVEDELFEIGYTQNADTMYLTTRTNEPRKLVRSSHTSWTLSTYTRTNDPFTSAGEYPATCAFYEGRLWFASTDDSPETLWSSRAPDTAGNPRYDDFTTGTDPTDALMFTLAPQNGKVDVIRWLAATTKFIALGTFGGLSRMQGSGYDEAISPTSIQVKPVDAYGCENVAPIRTGDITIYVQRGGLILRSLEYDAVKDMYISVDKNLVSDLITDSGIKQIAFQQGRPDIIWCVRNDGVLLGLTFKSREDVSGWHKHILGGTDVKVLSVGVIPQDNNFDQVWVVVERTLNGKTRRYVEYFSEPVEFCDIDDFYSGNKEEDTDTYLNAIYEKQKEYIHLDSSLTYNAYDRTSGITISISDTTGTITVTADNPIFTSDDVGNEIRKKAIKGVGTGRAKITAYTSSTEVTAEVLVDFDSNEDISNWAITVKSISGLGHLEGETVGVVTDGGVHSDLTVSNGSVSLTYEATVVHIGLRYTGFVKSMPLVSPAISDYSQVLVKNINQVGIRFYQTLGGSFGGDLYNMTKILFRSTSSYTDRPPEVFTGIRVLKYGDKWDRDKFIIIRQAQPLPCNVQVVEVFMDTSEE